MTCIISIKLAIFKKCKGIGEDPNHTPCPGKPLSREQSRTDGHPVRIETIPRGLYRSLIPVPLPQHLPSEHTY